MSAKFEKLFPTLVSKGKLTNSARLNTKLMHDISAFSKEDKMGIQWSKENYKGGYTSYASLSDLQHRSPSFLELSEKLQPHVRKFASTLGWAMKDCELRMNACWMNIMPRNTYHTLHLHPHSVLSGTYYVSTPKDSVPLKIEDPRMGFFMNAPLSKYSMYHEVKVKEGEFVLFESWLRHEVPPNQSKTPRISISFNYELVPKE